MNHKLVTALFVLSFPLSAFSADPTQATSGWNNPGQRLEHLAETLGLSPDQKTKVEAIFNAQKEKAMALHQDTRVQLQSVLTPEQLTKFDEMHEGRRHEQPGLSNGH